MRFGGALTLDEAWAHGIDHVAIAAGAGRPTIIDIKNNLIRGIRKASDFLMALQLTGAFKADALSNLQVRLPAVVIGGGLTGVDTATELLAYYPLQVEKILDRYDALVAAVGASARPRARSTPRSGRFSTSSSTTAGRCGPSAPAPPPTARRPTSCRWCAAWGGVTLAYRKRLQDSPAYRLNHEEVDKALEEGIAFAENLDPVEAIPDEYGHVAAMAFTQRGVDGTDDPGRAAGAHRARRRRDGAERDLREGASRHLRARRQGSSFFQGFRAVRTRPGGLALEADAERLLHLLRPRRPLRQLLRRQPPALQRQRRQGDGLGQGRLSARRRALRRRRSRRSIRRRSRNAIARWAALVARFDDQLLARVERVVRLTPTIVEVIVRAPAAARHFHPGQFYRLQNFERGSVRVRTDDHVAALLMEGIALTGAWVDREQGLLSLITLEMGVSSRLCAYLQPGEPVVVMGPTGTPTEIPAARDGAAGRRRARQRRALLDRQGAQGAGQPRALFRRLPGRRRSLQARGDRGGDRSGGVGHRFGRRHRARGAPQDRHFRGNIVQAMVAYAEGRLGERVVPLASVGRIIAIGSDRMMHAVTQARHGVLAPHLSPATSPSAASTHRCSA